MQKSEIARGMMRMMLDGEAGREAAEGMTFEAYLRGCSQSPATIRDFWDVICVSALNEPCSQASAKYGMQVFQEAFLGDRDGYRLGYARVPLSMLYERLPEVEVRTGAGVQELVVEQGVVRGVRMKGGEVIGAGHVVLAAGGAASLALLKPVLDMDSRLAGIGSLRYRPILGAHLLYDRPVGVASPVALVGTNLQWVFVDQERPELVHGVVSAADLLPSNTDLAGLFDGELKRVFPTLRDHRLVDSVIVKDSRATFRPLPGTDRLRPTQATRIPGLTLAGDYTRTGWPATMEGAARSGELASRVVVGQ
jgi:zeta-carotene desaturase